MPSELASSSDAEKGKSPEVPKKDETPKEMSKAEISQKKEEKGKTPEVPPKKMTKEVRQLLQEINKKKIKKRRKANPHLYHQEMTHLHLNNKNLY